MPGHDAEPKILDRTWALTSAVAGLVAVTSYGLLVAAPIPPPLSVLLAGAFGLGIGAASIGMYLGVLRSVAPRAGLLAAAFNCIAGALVVTMALVQMAIAELSASRADVRMLAPVHLGIDVAWDLYIGAGTLLVAIALRTHPSFGVGFGLTGAIAALALLVLNALTFPRPPANAGLLDVGPVIGLWYMAVSVRLGLLLRASAASRPAAEASPGIA
jgi:hypothetical protein